MSETLWACRALPRPAPEPAVRRWEGAPATVAELTALRLELHAAMLDGARPAGAGDDDIERLLLPSRNWCPTGCATACPRCG
jgi:hypothetical protein